MRKLFVSDVTFCKDNGSGLSFREKLNIAERLQKAGLDAIEFSAPADRPEDTVIYSTVAQTLKDTRVVVASGFTLDSLKRGFECVKDAAHSGIKVELPVSTALMEYMYHYKAPRMLEKIKELCAAAKEMSEYVEFSCVDATRADSEFVAECCLAAYESGANRVTLCDTAGVAFPEEMAGLVKTIADKCDAEICVQPSNELELGAAVALAAISAGACGVKTDLIGNGVTAAQLAQLLRIKGEELGAEANLDITVIGTLLSNDDTDSQNINDYTVDSVKFDASFGADDIAEFALSLGYELSSEDINGIYEEFKRLIDKKGWIGKRELEAVVASCSHNVPSTYHVENYVVNSGDIITATANITLSKDGEILSGVSTGDGPIDAAFHAIEQIVGHIYELDDFKIYAVTKSREAIGSSIIRLRANGKLYGGHGASTDIIGACIRAYINALNKIVYEEK